MAKNVTNKGHKADLADAFASRHQDQNMYQQYMHIMDKEEPTSSSGGSIGMVNMVGISSMIYL